MDRRTHPHRIEGIKLSNETNLTIRGRLTEDPDLRYSQSGAGVANFRVAVNASKFDRDSNTWKDQPAKFWRCNAWDQGKLTRAQNAANMLKKGDSVIVYGELVIREYDKDGETRTAEEIRVESIGKDLTFHGQAYAANQPADSNQGGWGSSPQASNDGWGNTSQSEVPF